MVNSPTERKVLPVPGSELESTNTKIKREETGERKGHRRFFTDHALISLRAFHSRIIRTIWEPGTGYRKCGLPYLMFCFLCLSSTALRKYSRSTCQTPFARIRRIFKTRVFTIVTWRPHPRARNACTPETAARVWVRRQRRTGNKLL